ncbi:MAG: RNA 3'-terminal phosphate cyclase [Nanobdellota archaeon]
MIGPLEIDGSEGGGQMLRMSIALSLSTGKAFDMTNIRAKRPKPGLKAQHLKAIKAAKELFSAKTEGDHLGSQNLRFIPGKLKRKSLNIDIGTAGSVTLLLQALLPALIREKDRVRLSIRGGTDVKWSMPFDYLDNVVLPFYRIYADIEVKLRKRGYFPKGGGEVEIKVKGNDEDKGIELSSQGKLVHIKGIANSSSDLDVNEKSAQSAKSLLRKYDCPVRIDTRTSRSESTGGGIVLWATLTMREDEIERRRPIRLGGDELYEKDPYSPGQEAARKLLKSIDSGICADEHLTDNLIPLLGLYGGEIKTGRMTDHMKAGIEVCKKFLDKDLTKNIIFK